MDHHQAERIERLRRLAAVGMLMPSYGHEINNVLGSILGTAQLMAMRETNPEIRERLAVIIQSVQRGISLTQGLAVIAAGDQKAHQPVDAHAIIIELAADGVLSCAGSEALQARKSRVWVEGSAFREALIVLGALLSGQLPVVISTSNRATASGGRTTDDGDAWLCITLNGTRIPTPEERLLITTPMAAGTSSADILLAGAAAVIKQGRGRIVVDGPHDKSELSVFFPTAP